MITKETFYSFLRDNGFYDPWMEAYKIDNAIFEDDVPLDEFFQNKEINEAGWFYNGIYALAWVPEPVPGLYKSLIWRKHRDWRKKYHTRMTELDDMWINLCWIFRTEHE